MKNSMRRIGFDWFFFLFIYCAGFVILEPPTAFAAAGDVVFLSDEITVAAEPSKSQVGMGAAFDGTNYLVGIRTYDGEKTDVAAQFLDANGAPVGPRISMGRSGGIPQVVYGDKNYLMIWDDYSNGGTVTNTYASLVSITGTASAPFAISPSPYNQGLAVRNVAFDGLRYLVVWEDQRVTQTSGIYAPRVYGRFISKTGAPVGEEFQITQDRKGRAPAIAVNIGYLVVWTDGANIMARLVGSSPDVLGRAIVVDRVNKRSDADAGDMPIMIVPLKLLARYAISYGEPVNDTEWRFYTRVMSVGGAKDYRKVLYEGATTSGCFITGFDENTYLAVLNTGSGTDAGVRVRHFDYQLNPLGNDWQTVLAATEGAKVPVGGLSVFDGARYLMIASRADVNPGPELTGGETYARFIDRTTCDYAFKEESRDFGYNGGTFALNVTASYNCLYEPPVVGNPAWISTDVLKWTGRSGPVKIKVNKYVDSYKPRTTGSGLTVGGKPFTINQSGKQCGFLRVVPTGKSFTKDGSSGWFDVTVSPTDCPWSASNVSADPAWIHITSASSFIGGGRVEYTVDSNTDAGAKARTGTMKAVFAAETGSDKTAIFTVRQAK